MLEDLALFRLVEVVVDVVSQSPLQTVHLSNDLMVLLLDALDKVVPQLKLSLFDHVALDLLARHEHFLFVLDPALVHLELHQILFLQFALFLLDHGHQDLLISLKLKGVLLTIDFILEILMLLLFLILI